MQTNQAMLSVQENQLRNGLNRINREAHRGPDAMDERKDDAKQKTEKIQNGKTSAMPSTQHRREQQTRR